MNQELKAKTRKTRDFLGISWIVSDFVIAQIDSTIYRQRYSIWKIFNPYTDIYKIERGNYD